MGEGLASVSDCQRALPPLRDAARRRCRIIGPQAFSAARPHPRWAALLVLAVATSALFTATAGAGTFKGHDPKPIAGQGYHQVFRDDFDKLGSTAWGKGTWYDPGSPSNAIFVRDGVLNLVSRRSQGYPDITLSSEAGSKRRVFKRGYFEARMKWTRGKGAWPAFWLSSYRNATNQAWPSINPYCERNGLASALCWNSELDVFEGQGLEPHTFYGTLHRNTNGSFGVRDRTNHPAWKRVGPNLTKRFHKYAVLWTANEVRWYLDGHKILRTSTFASTDQPMFLLFDMWIGWADTPDASTPDALRTKVDWVRVWRR